MDYMNLGVRSRKTGISVKENITKDEFDMENIDEFFKDNASIKPTKKTPTFAQSPRQQRLLSSRRDPSRRQSSLFNFSNNNNTNSNNYNEFSSPHIMSPSIHRSAMSNNNTTHNFTSDMLHSIREDDEFHVRHQSSIRSRKRQRLSSRMPNYKTSYGFTTTPTTVSSVTSNNQMPLMSPHIQHDEEEESMRYDKRKRDDNSWLNYDSNPYLKDTDEDSDVPDLTAHDLTVDNTSLVTSDDARLESEASSNRSSLSPESEFSSDEEDNDEIIKDDILLQQEEEGDVDATYIPSSPISTAYFHDQAVDTEHNETDPVRKSDRIKIPTLDYWRNEKIVYQRKNKTPAVDIVKIVTYDDDQSLNIRDKGREDNRLDNTTEFEYDSDASRRPEGSPNAERTRANKQPSKMRKGIVKDTRNGAWLKDGEFKANVFKTKKAPALISETIAYAPGTYQMEKVKQNDKERYSLAITFDKHKDLFASGMLKLPVDGKRTVTNSQNAFITFYMIRGILEVTLNKEKFIVTSGTTFQVPAFNRYAFKNKGYQEVQLFFVQVIVPENFNQPSKKNTSKKNNDTKSQKEYSSSHSSQVTSDRSSNI